MLVPNHDLASPASFIKGANGGGPAKRKHSQPHYGVSNNHNNAM